MAKLVLSAAGAIRHQCFVDEGRVTVGRDPANAIVVDDPAVSREHAAISGIGHDHILEDLGSANGTRVNGRPVTRHILQHGDVIALGDHVLRYLNPRAAPGVDPERTMLIPGLRADAAMDAPPASPPVPLPAKATARASFPTGRLEVTGGPRSGEAVALDRVVTLVGWPGAGLAVVTRRPHGFFVTHVEGRRTPSVNGRAIGHDPVPLRSGDTIVAGGESVTFRQD